jgi:hypothetical protein
MHSKGDSLSNTPDADSPSIGVIQSASRDVEQTPSDNRSGTRGGRDPNIVDWDGSDDPKNPTNWTDTKVATLVVIVSTITFLRFVE